MRRCCLRALLARARGAELGGADVWCGTLVGRWRAARGGSKQHTVVFGADHGWAPVSDTGIVSTLQVRCNRSFVRSFVLYQIEALKLNT